METPTNQGDTFLKLLKVMFIAVPVSHSCENKLKMSVASAF